MTETEAALLRSIEAAPGDDAPRLVYADWCDENGRPELAIWLRAVASAPRAGAAIHATSRVVGFSPFKITGPRPSDIRATLTYLADCSTAVATMGDRDLIADIARHVPLAIEGAMWLQTIVIAPVFDEWDSGQFLFGYPIRATRRNPDVFSIEAEYSPGEPPGEFGPGFQAR